MIVVKVGGSEGVDTGSVCADLAEWVSEGGQAVLVHGGSHEANLVSEKLGHPPRFVTSATGHSSRYTDRQTAEILAMVMAGKISTLLVERLQKLGVDALGLSGVDGRLLEAKRKSTLRAVENGKTLVLRGEYSGRVERVNVSLLQSLLGGGYLPVVAPLAISHEHEMVNVDGDRAAAAIGASLRADTVVLLTNVPGVLADPDDEASLVDHISLDEAEKALECYARGRMKRKLLGAIESLEAGVGRVIIADGRSDRPLQRALAGEGTVIQ